jgi:hypothetical protein
LDAYTAMRINEAIETTRFGEIRLIMHDGQVCRIETRVAVVKWSKKDDLDNGARTENTTP